MADTRLNAIERGRVVGPGTKTVELIGRALGLIDNEMQSLREAGAHDRCMLVVQRNLTKPHQAVLIALALDAARVLSEDDCSELGRAIDRLVTTRERLHSITEGAPMS